MKVLFTGVSSFTGFWIANYFGINGYDVDAILTKKTITQYDSIRTNRLLKLNSNIKLIYDCKFGDNNFLSLLKNNKLFSQDYMLAKILNKLVNILNMMHYLVQYLRFFYVMITSIYQLDFALDLISCLSIPYLDTYLFLENRIFVVYAEYDLKDSHLK